MRRLLVVGALAALTLAVFGQTVGFDFVSLDDRVYVADNPHVRPGISPGGVLWAFTATQQANWHPVTWISLMLDATIAGVRPGVFHATNVLLHLAAAILLFLALDRMTGNSGSSGFVAALFAVHPLHVESVAWIAERKDVLSGVFCMLTVLLWLRWLERPSAARYVLALSAFALGLMAKPMLVSLPIVLLLLDLWPLGRWRPGSAEATSDPRSEIRVTAAAVARGGPPTILAGARGLARLCLEKTPFFLLAAVSSIVTFLVQRQGGAVSSFTKHPLGVRAGNAVVTAVVYLAKMVWPTDLAFFYPHPRASLPAWQIAGAGLVLTLITLGALGAARRRPFITAGWLWYLVTLLPVIGLVQVGEQARADRYTYLPLIGPFMIVAWGAPELLNAIARRFGAGRRALSFLACLVVAALAAAAFAQTRHWKDSVSLYAHALDATADNAVARDFLGLALRKQGKLDEAIAHFREAVRIEPEFREAHCDLASALNARGRYDEAIVWSRRVLAAWPGSGRGHAELGLALAHLGKRDEGITHLREALRIKPDFQDARVNLGVTLAEAGRFDEAAAVFAEAARADPSDADVRRFLALARAKAGEAPPARPSEP